MRVLALTPTFLPVLGGAELVILHVYRRLAARHSVLVLTPYLSENLLKCSSSSEYEHLINFPVQRYHDRFTLIKIRGHRISQGLIPPFSLSVISALKRAAEEFHPDVINVHYVMPTGLAGLYAQKVLKIPCVITYNGRDVPGPGIPPMWKYWHRLIGRNCADMTFVSKYCRDVIYGSTSHVGHVIYNGVNYPVPVSSVQLTAFRSKFKLSPDEPVLFSLQRVDALKRTDVIIRAMPQILENEPKTRLIVGGKGADLPRLKNIAAQLGVARRVIFTGYIPDDEIPIFHTAANLFVFHSTYETFGIVLAEAMNYGNAVVSVANTAISEVVNEGETGLLVPTLDHVALAKAVSRLLKDKALREEMGKRGRKKVRTLFGWDSVADKYEHVLESATSKRDVAS